MCKHEGHLEYHIDWSVFFLIQVLALLKWNEREKKRPFLDHTLNICSLICTYAVR